MVQHSTRFYIRQSLFLFAVAVVFVTYKLTASITLSEVRMVIIRLHLYLFVAYLWHEDVVRVFCFLFIGSLQCAVSVSQKAVLVVNVAFKNSVFQFHIRQGLLYSVRALVGIASACYYM